MPYRRWTGLVLLLGVVAGCGGPAASGQQAAPSPDGGVVVAAGAIAAPCAASPTEPGEVVYPGVGVRTYPAPAGTPVRLTGEQALAGPDVASWGPGSSRETGLRLVTTGAFGCGSTPAGVVRQAGWVVIIRGTAPTHGGSLGAPTPDPAASCSSVVIVDARTGALLSNVQTCGEAVALRG